MKHGWHGQRRQRRHGRAYGITLIELLVFIIIVTIGLLGALAAFGPSVRGSADPMIRKQTLNLAESMLREVMQKSYQNAPTDPSNSSSTLGCTPTTSPACIQNSQTSRPNYNDVDDYINFNQTGIVSVSGAAVPGLSACTQSVAVAPGSWSGLAGKIVTVTANCGSETVTLSAFRGNYGD